MRPKQYGHGEEAHLLMLDDNPEAIAETSLQTEKVTVCDLLAEGIIGSYLYKNKAGHNVTANGQRYRAINNDIFVPELGDVDVNELWFQQNGATYNKFIEGKLW